MKDAQHIPWITKIINPVAQYYFKCSRETQRNIKLLSSALLFTMLVCGSILALSVTTFCFTNNYWVLFLFLPVSFWLYWQLELPIIFSDPRKYQTLARAFRVFVALVFSLFNSCLIDSWYFSKDIGAARQVEIQQKENEARRDFASQNAFVMQRKMFLENQIDSISVSLTARQDSLNSELNGTGGTHKVGMGPVWLSEYAMYKSDSLSAAGVIASKRNELNALDSVASANSAAEDRYVRRIPEQVSNGINEKMTLLHRIIFNETFTNIFSAILWFIVTTILELIPLLSKYFYGVSEYFERADADREVRNNIEELDKDKEMKLAAEKAVYNLQAEQVSIARNYHLDKLHDAMLYHRSILDETEREIEFWEESKRRTKEKYPEYYDSHIEPIAKHAIEDIREISSASISQ